MDEGAVENGRQWRVINEQEVMGWGGIERWRPEKQAENKQIEREKQAQRAREARRAVGKLSMS